MSLREWAKKEGFIGMDEGTVPELVGYGIGFSHEYLAIDVADELTQSEMNVRVVYVPRGESWYVEELLQPLRY